MTTLRERADALCRQFAEEAEREKELEKEKKTKEEEEKEKELSEKEEKEKEEDKKFSERVAHHLSEHDKATNERFAKLEEDVGKVLDMCEKQFSAKKK